MEERSGPAPAAALATPTRTRSACTTATWTSSGSTPPTALPFGLNLSGFVPLDEFMINLTLTGPGCERQGALLQMYYKCRGLKK
ncbi:hypothetical protein HGM15179_005566 [Zosterops borbonicus]|uniref:Uncharacterized protein n=1 Tax=Zosterops borbonicus TaxID=364589 RepID=A0A8K1LP50_9PASS|nr:hypothetical protein HGM15179_005566 [Zosterops borbonicus]